MTKPIATIVTICVNVDNYSNTITIVAIITLPLLSLVVVVVVVMLVDDAVVVDAVADQYCCLVQSPATEFMALRWQYWSVHCSVQNSTATYNYMYNSTNANCGAFLHM